MIQAGCKQQAIKKEDWKTLCIKKKTPKFSSKIVLSLSHEILLIISNKFHSDKVMKWNTQLPQIH